MTATKVLTEALRTVLTEAEGLERELAQAHRDVERIARENSAMCDQIEDLRAEVKRLRAELSGADTEGERGAA